MPTHTIVQWASDRGVDFKVTPGSEKQLVRLDFDADEIDAIRKASFPGETMKRESAKQGVAENGPPIVPGKDLPAGEERRKVVYEQIVKIAKLSTLDLSPVETRHLTLWAAKGDQDRFLDDIKKIENYLEQKLRRAAAVGPGQASGTSHTAEDPLRIREVGQRHARGHARDVQDSRCAGRK